MNHQFRIKSLLTSVLVIAFLLSTGLISSDCFGNPPSSQGGNHSNHSGGGKPPSHGGSHYTRQVVTDTHTGKVLSVTESGRYHKPQPLPDPGSGPGPRPYPPPPPPPRPYPYYPRPVYPVRPSYPVPVYPTHPTYPAFPGYPFDPLPGYPPPPPGFPPPPPPFWTGFIITAGTTVIRDNYNSATSNLSTGVKVIGLFNVMDEEGTRCGGLLLYFNSTGSAIGGYFNPAGTKNTRPVQGIVSKVNGVKTAEFTVKDNVMSKCTVLYDELLHSSILTGTMIATQGGSAGTGGAFTLERVK